MRTTRKSWLLNYFPYFALWLLFAPLKTPTELLRKLLTVPPRRHIMWSLPLPIQWCLRLFRVTLTVAFHYLAINSGRVGERKKRFLISSFLDECKRKDILNLNWAIFPCSFLQYGAVDITIFQRRTLYYWQFSLPQLPTLMTGFSNDVWLSSEHVWMGCGQPESELRSWLVVLAWLILMNQISRAGSSRLQFFGWIAGV